MLRKTIYSLTAFIFVSALATAVNGQNKQNSGPKTLKISTLKAGSFKKTDIGAPAVSGTITFSGDGIDITAGGEDIWGTKDEFSFAFLERTGDFDFITRIKSLSAADLYTKAGIMAREELTPDSRHIFFQVFPDNRPRNKNNGGCEFQYRLEKGGEMKAVYPKSSTGEPEFPVVYPNTWIRLQRIKNDFTGYYSSDGINWKAYTTFTLNLPSKVYLGLAVTSHNPKTTASAAFRDIAEIIN